MAAVAMVFAGCQKENKGIRLFAEGFNGDSKLAAYGTDGTKSKWLEGDQVNINGAEYDITLDGENAYVVDVPTNANGYVAFYPTRLGAATNLTFPSEFYYIPVYNEQYIDAPMYAEASGENVSSLYFKHLGAALNLHITVTEPNYPHDPNAVNISRIEICSNNYQLNGSFNVQCTYGNLTVVPVPYVPDEEVDDKGDDVVDDDVVPTERKVTILPDNGTHFTISRTADIQIPVLPVGEDNKFTIKVYRYDSKTKTVSRIFKKTQEHAGSLARGQMAYVNVELNGEDLNSYEDGGDEYDG